MTYEDAGHYAAKHPEGIIDPSIEKQITEREKNNRVSCAAAHAIAGKQKCSPKIVGLNIDLMERRINKCQLGLFGYGKKKYKAVEATQVVDKEFEEAIRSVVVNDCIPCEAAWKVAKQMKRTKMEVAAACECFGIKIRQCQLGAF